MDFTLLLVALLALYIPWISITTRRLHDAGKSGWWQLIALFPAIGGILLLFMLLSKSDNGPNQYGASTQSNAHFVES